MNNQEIKTVVLSINSEQAKTKLAELTKRFDVIRQKRESALNMGDTICVRIYTQEAKNSKCKYLESAQELVLSKELFAT